MQRILVLSGLFGVLTFGILFCKLWQLQVVQHEKLENKAITQQTREISSTANRGTIYDRSGETLAMSATVYNIQLSPKEILACQEAYREKAANAAENGKTLDYPEPTNEFIASNLAQILDLDEADILKRLAKTSSMYEMIKWRVEDDERDAVISFINENHITGIYTPPTTKRYYPKNSLAAQVIGWVNYSEGRGAYGVEAQYDEALSGETGRIVTAKNGDGTQMLYRYEDYYDATDGDNLTLTLDSAIQSYCESILKKGIEQFEVQDGGFCIAMDPNTGEILAWANSPTYDLNNPRVVSDPVLNQYLADIESGAYTKEEAYQKALAEGASSEEARDKAISAAETEVLYTQWTNKAITSTYEPGSTFKSIVLAAALEEGVVTENSHFYCPGYIMVEGWSRPISCSKKAPGHGDQDLALAVANSCNPALIDIGKKLGAEKFYEYWENFGFTSKTGIELPSEEKSTFWDKELFVSPSGVTQLATASFGQRFTTTPIHLITALSAVINGGHLLEPYLVQSVTDAEGNVVSYHEPKEVRQVISQETSDLVRSYMESVVNDPGGTGKNAKVEGYHIGGKTGSSQTLDSKDHIIVSFLGFAPADDPEVIVLLGYDWPQPAAPGENTTADGIYISGGNMAAPMAGELIANILDYLGYEKSGSDVNANGVTIPHLVGKTPEEARTALNNLGLNVRLSGEGAVVTDQMPTAGSSVPKGSSTVLYLGEEKPETTVEMPDLSGMTYDEAKAALEKVGLYLEATGTGESGKVFSQSVNAGTVLDVGTAVEVKFTDDTAPDNGVTTGGGWAPKEEEE